MPKVHELKTWPEYFFLLGEKLKTAEIRRNDRDFQVCDEIIFKEWNPETEKYTGRSFSRTITCITQGFGLSDGFVVLSLSRE